MGQTLDSIARFLQISQGDSRLHVTTESDTLKHIDSFGAYKLALKYANTAPNIGVQLKNLIVLSWDVTCLERINTDTPQHPNELKIIFHEAPEGGLAQQRVIELLKEMESFQ